MKKTRRLLYLFMAIAWFGLMLTPERIKAEEGFDYESNVSFRFVEFLKFCKITRCTDNRGDDCTTPESSMRMCIQIPIKF